MPGDKEFMMVFRLRGLNQSQYLRLRGSNLPAAVPFETDAAIRWPTLTNAR